MKTTKTKRPSIANITPDCRALVIDLHTKGETNQFISDVVKLYSRGAICSLTKKLNIELSEEAIKYKNDKRVNAKSKSEKPKKPYVPMTDDVVKEILAMYDAGTPVYKIVKAFKGNVRGVLADNGRSTAAKSSIYAITPEMFEQIRQLRASGLSLAKISDVVGIYTARQIGAIVKKL